MGGFFTLGLYSGRKSTCEFPCQPASSFLSRAEFGEVLSRVRLQPPGFPSPPPQRGAAVQAGRGVEGNATDRQLPPRGSWLCFICKAPEEAGEFPEAPSSCLLWYQHLAKASLTDFLSCQILAVPLCFLAVLPASLHTVDLGEGEGSIEV